MQHRGTHLFNLPSILKKRGSNSTLNSSNDSAISQSSPEAPSIPLAFSSRSSLAEPSSLDDYKNIYHDWSLLSITRVLQLPGMVLVALYHLPTATMYTWPLQTNPKAPQPEQGTVFIAVVRNDKSDDDATQVTSESLKVLTGVLLTWMRQKDQSKVKIKLGEREEDAEELGKILSMAKIDKRQRTAILDRQVIRPVQEWSGASVVSDRKSKERILSSLNTNTKPQRDAPTSKSKLAPPKVPSIEVTSPNSSDILTMWNQYLQDHRIFSKASQP